MIDPSCTVLLVEDDPNDVILTQRAFRNAKLINPLQVVDDGEGAVAYLAGEGKYADRTSFPLPTLVLLDLKLPKKPGHEVLEWLRAQSGLKRIPVVVLTSSSQSSDVNKAYDLGANSYLVKPVEPDRLLEMAGALHLYWMVMNKPPEVTSA